MERTDGITVKGYVFHEQIGAGSFGPVYRAHQTAVGREVAIKIILPGFANQPDFIRRFETEAQMVARLEHPHIVPLYDYWRDPNGAYLVMRWLRGGSLREALEAGPYDLAAAALLLDQVASALALAHRSGVVHGNLKPSNILLDEEGNAYLADFGIVKMLGEMAGQDAVASSLDCLSPEQARGEPVTPLTDIYSLGVVLYELLTGEHPFHQCSPVERFYKHLNDPLPGIETLEPGVQEAINAVIQKATAKNPTHRYADVLAMAAAFRQAIQLTEPRTPTSIVEQLTLREHEVLQFLVDGLSNREIAANLFITEATVKWHIKQIYRKLGVRSRVQAIVRARELDLIATRDVSVSLPATADAVSQLSPPELESPYKGLQAFQPADHRDFFGREELTARLIQRLAEKDRQARFLAVIGPSGSGKSSLVNAGLIPSLWRGDLPGSERWFVVSLVPGPHPLDELEVALTRVAGTLSGSLKEHLARDARGLLRAAGLILPNDGSELVLIIDQFEEVFTLVEDEATRQHFLNLLYTAVTDPRSRVRVIITLRADFYDRPLRYPDFGDLVRNRMETILPLTAKSLERAITGPAERVGVTFEEGLVATIVADMNYQAGALPLLQYALTELFERRDGRMLTHAAYREIGGAVGALAKRAEELYSELNADGREAVRQIFLRLVTLGEGTEDTRRRTPRSELLALGSDADLVDEIIDTFAAYRLLALDHDPATRAPTVELAHEAILREWERLRKWLDESRADVRMQRQLAHMAEEWWSSQQDKSFLLRGSRLEMFESWMEQTELAITPQERAFMQASLAQRERERQTEQTQKAREAHLEQRSRRFLRGLVAVFAVAAVIAVALSLFAFNQSKTAQLARINAEEARAISDENAKYASSIALAAAARSALAYSNPDQAIALAVAANTLTDHPPAYAQRVLYEVSVFVPTMRSLLPEPFFWLGGISDISPDGRRAMTFQLSDNADSDGSVIYWDLMTGQILARWTSAFLEGRPPFCNATNPIFAPGGETGYATTVTPDLMTGEIIEFEVSTGQELRHLTPPEGFPCGMIISSEAQALLVPTLVHQEGSGFMPVSIDTWEIATGRLIDQVRLDVSGLVADVSDVFFTTSTRDGRKLLFAYDTGLIVLWDTRTGEQIRTIRTAGGTIIPFSVSSGIVTLSGTPGELGITLTLWDENTGEMLRQEVLDAPLFWANLSPDGHTLIVPSSTVGNYTLFDTETWQSTNDLLYGVPEVFTPDGRYVLTSSESGQRFWSLENEAELMRIDGLTSGIVGMASSPDGRALLTQEWNGPLTLWDLATGHKIRVLGETQNTYSSIAFSPDGRRVVFNSRPGDFIQDISELCPTRDSHLIMVDVDTGEVLWQATEPTGFVRKPVFTGDGSRVLTNNRRCDSFITVWDAATGEKIGEWEGHQSHIWDISASPDGKWIATGSHDMTAILWDAATGAIAYTLVHDTPVISVAFSPDSTKLLTVTLSGNLHFWDTASGQEIQRLSGHISVARGQFSPDGQYVVSDGEEGGIIVWEWQTGNVVRQINALSVLPGGSRVAFSPDGQSILVPDEKNRVIRQLDLMLEPGELLDWVYANRYIRDLTCNERELYHIEPLC